jgi:FCD domain
MTSPRIIRLSADDTLVIAVGLANRGDTIAGPMARERILRGHKMAIEPIRAIAAFFSNGVLAQLVGQLLALRISPYFGRLASQFEDASTRRQAFAELRQIRLSIANGDPESARRAARHHLCQSQERYSRSFGETATP